MNTERLNDELTITGLIFIFLVMVPLMWTKIVKVENELNQAKTIAVELYEESTLAYEMIESLNKELDLAGEYINHKKLLKDLSQIKQNKDLTWVVCFTESSFRYNVKHTGSHDKTTIGICGIKTVWIDIIPELNQENINTLYAGSLVITYLLNKHNNDLFKAIKEFKGANKNLTTTHKTIRLYNKIKQN